MTIRLVEALAAGAVAATIALVITLHVNGDTILIPAAAYLLTFYAAMFRNRGGATPVRRTPPRRTRR